MNYNGWRNRETWLVNVWFGDSWECESDVDNTKEFLEDSIDDLPGWIQDFIDETVIDWAALKEHAAIIEKEREESESV